MARPEYKVTIYVEKKNGEVVPIESLTPEEVEEMQENMRKRLSAWGNRYYAEHPDQYEKL